MPEFGYLIIRNPGPDTELIYRGLTGDNTEHYLAPDDVLDAVEKEKQPTDQVHLLTVYEADEGNGVIQLTSDSYEEGVTFRERGGGKN